MCEVGLHHDKLVARRRLSFSPSLRWERGPGDEGNHAAAGTKHPLAHMARHPPSHPFDASLASSRPSCPGRFPAFHPER
jgi:hypothetical protein